MENVGQARPAYEAPVIEEIASLHELTLTTPIPKHYEPQSEGFSFNGKNINVS